MKPGEKGVFYGWYVVAVAFLANIMAMGTVSDGSTVDPRTLGKEQYKEIIQHLKTLYIWAKRLRSKHDNQQGHTRLVSLNLCLCPLGPLLLRVLATIVIGNVNVGRALARTSKTPLARARIIERSLVSPVDLKRPRVWVEPMVHLVVPRVTLALVAIALCEGH